MKDNLGVNTLKTNEPRLNKARRGSLAWFPLEMWIVDMKTCATAKTRTFVQTDRSSSSRRFAERRWTSSNRRPIQLPAPPADIKLVQKISATPRPRALPAAALANLSPTVAKPYLAAPGPCNFAPGLL